MLDAPKPQKHFVEGTDYAFFNYSAEDDLLGTGSEANVFRATTPDGVVVALKQFKRADNPDALAAYKREIAILVRNGNYVDSNLQINPFIAQTFFEGISLRNFIYAVDEHDIPTAKNMISPADIEQVAYNLIRDFYRITLNRIVHCDLKPDNVLVNPHTKAVSIIDFGQAFFTEHAFPHDIYQGTPLYGAPEAFEPAHQNPHSASTPNSEKTELYTLGIILASMISERPYEIDSVTLKKNFKENLPLQYRELLRDVLEPSLHVSHSFNPALVELIQHITHPDPTQRPDNITLAYGCKAIPELHDIFLTETKLDALLGKLRKYPHLPHYVKNMLDSTSDLPVVYKLLYQLSHDSALKKKDKRDKDIITHLLETIHFFLQYESKKMLGLLPPNINRELILTLLHTEAEKNKKSTSKIHKMPLLPLFNRKKEKEKEDSALNHHGKAITKLERAMRQAHTSENFINVFWSNIHHIHMPHIKIKFAMLLEEYQATLVDKDEPLEEYSSNSTTTGTSISAQLSFAGSFY